MRLRDKTIIISLVTWVVMIVATYFGGEYTLRNNYLLLEQKSVENDIGRVNEIIGNMKDEVKTMNSSWAVWDDTYNYMKDRNKAFIDSNMTLLNCETAKIDGVLLFDLNKKLVFSINCNQDRTEIIPMPEGMMDHLQPNSKLLSVKDIGESVSGIIDTPSAMFFMASQTIVKSDNSGPVDGIILMTRYFDVNAFEDLKKTAKLDVAVHRVSDVAVDKATKERLLKLTNGENYLIDQSEDLLTAYTLVKDVDGKPVAMLEIGIPRNIYKAGLVAIRNFTVIFLTISILFTILQIIMLKRIIINRLESFNKEVTKIGDTKEFAKRLTVKGNDEITSISVETNKMLEQIQKYNDQQKELMDKISDAENFLKNIINSMPTSLIITNEKLEIFMSNSTAQTEFGIADAGSKNIIDFMPELVAYGNTMESAIVEHKVVHIDKFIKKNADNSTRFYNVTIFPLQSQDRLYLAIRMDDVTERIKLDEKVAQNDKLASIGILTAGIAHEINNPINFVIATVPSLKLNIADILTVLEEYKSLNKDTMTESKLNEIHEKMKSMDLDYTIKETDKLLAAIQDGANRTATIVKDLKVFTRLDEDVMKKANIEAGIDSTLTLLKSSFKNRIQVIKDFNNIPEIDCYPGRLNQVFMNILSNASDAIKESGNIIITTKQVDDDHVAIIIKDDGPGMSKEIQKKIFEPFFTTKEVGKGTGLGLSISFGIVRDHHGSIEVDSEIGKGTQFTITLPIHQQHD